MRCLMLMIQFLLHTSRKVTSLDVTTDVPDLVSRTAIPRTALPGTDFPGTTEEWSTTPNDTIEASSAVSQTTTNQEGPSDRTPLYIAGLFSLDGNLDASGVYVGSSLALKHVNQNPDVLPGYELIMTLSNSKCTDGVAIQKFFEQIFQAPQKILVVGPACSLSAQAIASTAHFWNLNVMSPTASSPALSNRKRYPTFFRIIPPETLLNPPFVRLMRHYNWSRVATIHQKDELFALSIDDLLTRLRDNNITVISSESFDEDPKNQVENLKKQDAKIIVVSMYEWNIRRVICEAFKLGMYGEGYMWLIPGWYNKDWYKEEPDGGIDCTVGEISLFIESTMYISTQERLLGKEDTVTVAGITPAEYTSQLWEHFSLREDEFQNYTMIPQASYGYDAIWAVALALNRSVEVLRAKVFSNGQQRRLEQFSHADHEMFNVIFDALGSVDFEGVSGPVSFSGSDRIGVMKIEQLQGRCPGDWANRGRYCYLFLPSELTWDEAVSSCSDLGGFLLSISSEEESLSLKELITEQDLEDGNRWWISLRRLPSGDLRWSDDLEEPVMWIPPNGDSPIDASDDPCFILDSSVNVRYSVSCRRRHSVICKQFAEFREVTVAEHDLAKDEIEWFSDIIWPGGAVPLDHTPQVIFTTVEIYEGVPFLVYIISCCLAGLGIILAVVCLAFNIYHKNQRFIKLSSPNLNSLIIFGCIMIYASTCLVGWEDPSINQAIFLKFCQIRVWFFSVGFVLSFGSMFSKTWRVHKVAALKNPKRVIITDRHLFLMVGVLLLIDVSLLSGWFIFNPMRVVKEYLHSEEDTENLLILTPYIQYCTTDNSLIWQGALYGYKALLLIFGVFLAWETRKVTIPALNDSKLIGLCVYNVVLLSAIGVGVNLALTTDPSPSFIFTSAIQIFCTSITLIIIFIPKMVSVNKYPEGKHVTTMKSESNFEMSSNGIAEMKDEITKLRSELKQEHPYHCKHTGCGLWLGRIMCACGDTVAESRNDLEYKSTETLSTVTNITPPQA